MTFLTMWAFVVDRAQNCVVLVPLAELSCFCTTAAISWHNYGEGGARGLLIIFLVFVFSVYRELQ